MRPTSKPPAGDLELPDDVFRRLVAAVDDYAIFLVSRDGHVLTWNRGAERITGYARDEIVGRPASILYAAVDAEAGKPARELELAAQTGRLENEGWQVRKDGSRFWADVTVTALYDDHGGLLAFAQVTHDLTDRKRAADDLVREQVARAKAEEGARRTRFLDELTQALAAPLEVADTLERIARALSGELADYVIVDVRDATGRSADLAIAHADPARTALVEALRRALPVSGEEHPVSVVLRSGKPLLLSDLQRGEALAVTPAVQALMNELDPTSFMIVPLASSAGRTFGTVSLVSCGTRRYQAQDLALAMDLAHRAALAIENAQLYEARRRAEDALKVLARAGEALVSSLDYHETLRNLGRAVVPVLADWCSVYMAGDDGALEALVLEGTNAELTEHAAELARRYPPRADRDYGLFHVMRTGEPLLMAEVPRELVEASALDDEHREALRRADIRSSIMVPLVVKDAVAGVLTLIGCNQRRYEAHDLELACELARRASIAVENARLYHDAQRAGQEAREAVRVRDEFISIASHELKTPLTALRMNTDGLQRVLQRAPGSDERLPRRVQMSLKQLDRLEALVQALLDVTRLSEGRLQLQTEEFDVALLAREVADRFAEPLAASGSALTVEAPEPVVGSWDRMRVDQVLTNLISNAIKYGEHKPIAIRVRLEAEQAMVSVHDDGIGVAPADQARIFDRFERAVSPRHFGGLGLGLWISRRMAEAMGGTLTVESAAGAGATFTLALPRGS